MFSSGMALVMVEVVYDSVAFKTESEIGHNVQEFTEGEVHIVLHMVCPRWRTKQL